MQVFAQVQGVPEAASHHTTHRDTDQGNGDTPHEDTVGSHAATRLTSDVLLMTCRVLITAHDGSTVEARALLDNVHSTFHF